MSWSVVAVKDAAGTSRNVVVWDDGSSNFTQAAFIVPAVPTVLGFEKRTVSTSVVAITASSVPAGSTHALVTLEGGDCRFRDDGSAASLSNTDGLLMVAGQAFEFTNLSALRFIRASYETSDVILQISYRKYG